MAFQQRQLLRWQCYKTIWILLFAVHTLSTKAIVGSLESTQEETSCVLHISIKIITKAVLYKNLRELSALNCEIQGAQHMI